MTSLKEEYKKRFGARIRELRIGRNMSQDELAKKIGYESRSTINKIEMGRNDLPRSKLVALANALDVTVDVLLDVVRQFPEEQKQQEVNRLFDSLSEDQQQLALALLRQMAANKER